MTGGITLASGISAVGSSGGGGGGTPTYGTVVVATAAATQNNYGPGTWGPGVLFKATPAAGGSTITGFSSTGWSAGQTGAVENQSSTDSFIFPHQSASSSAGNQFANANSAPATLAPLASASFLWDGSYFRFY